MAAWLLIIHMGIDAGFITVPNIETKAECERLAAIVSDQSSAILFSPTWTCSEYRSASHS